jgi:ubiquitin C-terminal hydrolase
MADLTRFSEARTDARQTYRLFSSIVHDGNLHVGHYWTYARREDGTWTEYNDTRAIPIKERYAIHEQAYILLYEKVI